MIKVTAWAIIGLMATAGIAAARHAPVSSLVGVSDPEARALHKVAIKDTRKLYQKTYKSSGKLTELADKAGIPLARLAHMAAVADFCRLYKVTPAVGELLALAGIRSMADLARQDATDLDKRFRAINEAREITGDLPPAEDLAGWIKDAGRLKPVNLEQKKSRASVR